MNHRLCFFTMLLSAYNTCHASDTYRQFLESFLRQDHISASRTPGNQAKPAITMLPKPKAAHSSPSLSPLSPLSAKPTQNS